MRVGEIDGEVFFSFQKENENQMEIERVIAKYIIDICRAEDISITVKASFDDIRKSLWNGMSYAVNRKDDIVCNDIIRCMEYINGMEIKSDESI